MKRLLLLILLSGLFFTGCSSLVTKHVEWETIEPETYPVLSAVGYAPISSQKGMDKNAKMLMAIKASKLEAYRELTEQVYGQKVDGDLSMANLVISDSSLQASVAGVIRGAKVVKTYPVGEDTYATELSLDFANVYDIYLSTAKPRKIRKVNYY